MRGLSSLCWRPPHRGRSPTTSFTHKRRRRGTDFRSVFIRNLTFRPWRLSLLSALLDRDNGTILTPNTSITLLLHCPPRSPLYPRKFPLLTSAKSLKERTDRGSHGFPSLQFLIWSMPSSLQCTRTTSLCHLHPLPKVCGYLFALSSDTTSPRPQPQRSRTRYVASLSPHPRLLSTLPLLCIHHCSHSILKSASC
jgi:hypothetical protein